MQAPRPRYPLHLSFRCLCGSHRTRWRWPAVVCSLGIAALAVLPLAGDDDVSDLLQSAKPATAPATLTAPDAPENRPTTDALGTLKPQAPAGARPGTITLNDGTTVEGHIWTTRDTPLRLWIDETKSYRDIDLALVKQIDVHVLAEAMEDDWRWLKEGSDQKVYSGKKYPTVSLAYKFTLLNGQEIEGTVVAPIYIRDSAKTHTLALYKTYKGKLDETLKDVVYIKAIQLDGPASTTSQPALTTKLPLLDD